MRVPEPKFAVYSAARSKVISVPIMMSPGPAGFGQQLSRSCDSSFCLREPPVTMMRDTWTDNGLLGGEEWLP
jgi:hypothetical protein